MAPAAVDTIEAHLKERNVEPSYYDLIVTGDLGQIGQEVSMDLFKKHGTPISEEQYQDCGLMIYREKSLNKKFSIKQNKRVKKIQEGGNYHDSNK